MPTVVTELESRVRRLPSARPRPNSAGPGATTPSGIVCFARRSAAEAMRGGPHCHSRFVLGVCLRGGAGLVIDDTLVTVRPGEAVLLFPYESHHFHRFEEGGVLWLFVGFDLADCGFLEGLRRRANPPDVGLTRDLALFLEGAPGGAVTRSGEIRRGARLLALLAGLAGRAEATPDTTDRHSGHPLVRAVLAEMSRDPESAGGLAALAGKLHVSESHLRRTFRGVTGVALGRFLATNRIRIARALLARGDLRVGEVAVRSGFSGPYAFSRAFRAATGMSPTEFRRRENPGSGA